MPDMGTAQFNETETIMSLGYAIWSFDGSSYQVSDPRHQYLSLAAGEPVAIMVSSQCDGWIKGAAAPHGLWKTGWLPLSHWRGIQFNWLQILTDNIGWKVYHPDKGYEVLSLSFAIWPFAVPAFFNHYGGRYCVWNANFFAGDS